MSGPAVLSIPCPACGSLRTRARGRKIGAFIRQPFEFHQCDDCGLMFVRPFSGFEIYNDEYYRGHGPDPYVDYETEYRDWRASDRGLEFDDMARIARAFLRRHDRVEAKAAPAVSPPSRDLRWLDFGCGAGAFLKYLRGCGSLAGRRLDLTGHDVGSYANLLKTKDGFRILNWNELDQEPTATFDVISMIEVIEHLPAPIAPLALVARLLKPGGLLLLTTGNLDCPVARRQGINYRYCAPEIHVSLFNPACLATLYRRVGLEPLQVQYHGAVKFKVVKSLRHHPVLRALAFAGLSFPPVVRAIDALYGVSAMPCAVKPATGAQPPAWSNVGP
jgi:2-polyprenyl-3-methyl-5-hydroxy-6-metoxy-1,4-benzoquinol methylase